MPYTRQKHRRDRFCDVHGTVQQGGSNRESQPTSFGFWVKKQFGFVFHILECLTLLIPHSSSREKDFDVFLIKIYHIVVETLHATSLQVAILVIVVGENLDSWGFFNVQNRLNDANTNPDQNAGTES